jgi:hypothetical protein
VLAAHLDSGNALFTDLQDTGRRPVAEQGRCNDVRLCQLIEPEGQRADFHGDQQHNAARA